MSTRGWPPRRRCDRTFWWRRSPVASDRLTTAQRSLCVRFGLSMDYEVFLLARVQEAHVQGEDNRASIARGLERSGRIITSAAGIVVLVSLSFVAADIVLIKALGLGTAIAVLLDATLVRALLVPATMRLLGDWNWWSPRWLPRFMRSGASRV